VHLAASTASKTELARMTAARTAARRYQVWLFILEGGREGEEEAEAGVTSEDRLQRVVSDCCVMAF